MNRYDLTHDGEDWKLQRQGAQRAAKVFSDATKEEAVKKTSRYMQTHPGSVLIHKQNGVYQEERTYPRKADPSSSPG